MAHMLHNAGRHRLLACRIFGSGAFVAMAEWWIELDNLIPSQQIMHGDR